MAKYYFNLPPITQLTISQQAALYETKQIALSGGPGTGKSVVSLWRHISNFKKNKKSLLLTYTTTLKMYLSECCNNSLAANNVKTSLKGKPKNDIGLDEVIVDEAQDLPVNYYEELKEITKVSYGADDSQILYPEKCSNQRDLKRIFPDNINCVLDKNFRSTQRIMQFAKQAFNEAYIPSSTISNLSNNIGELPVMLISDGNNYEQTNEKQNSSILEIIKSFRSDTHNIAILVPWKSAAIVFENVIKDSIDDYSIYYDDNTRFPNGCNPIKNVHITTFKSAKGLEFDTVIIPNFHKYNEVESLPECFHLTWKDYFVAVTRARSNLYLISNNDIPFLNSVVDKEYIDNNKTNSTSHRSNSFYDVTNLDDDLPF